jgi:hypothetical protein
VTESVKSALNRNHDLLSNTKLMKSNRVKHWGIVLTIFGLVIGVPAFWLLISADQYVATARIETNPNPDLRFYDPRSIQNKFEALQSPSILSNLVVELRLDTEWGKHDADRRKLDIAVATERLKRSVCIMPIPNTAFVDISVTSKELLESEEVANAVAAAFCDWKPWRSSGTNLMKILEQEYETADQNVKTTEAAVNRLRAELNPSEVLPETPDSKPQPYGDAVEKLERLKTARRIIEVKIASSWLPASPFSMVHRALSKTTPIYPSRTLGIILLDLSAMLVLCGSFLAARNWFAAGGRY